MAVLSNVPVTPTPLALLSNRLVSPGILSLLDSRLTPMEASPSQASVVEAGGEPRSVMVSRGVPLADQSALQVLPMAAAAQETQQVSVAETANLVSLSATCMLLQNLTAISNSSTAFLGGKLASKFHPAQRADKLSSTASARVPPRSLLTTQLKPTLLLSGKAAVPSV